MSRRSGQNSMQNKEKNETGSFQETLLYFLQILRGKITGGVLMGPAPIKTQTTPEEHWPKKNLPLVCVSDCTIPNAVKFRQATTDRKFPAMALCEIECVSRAHPSIASASAGCPLNHRGPTRDPHSSFMENNP